MISHIGIDYGSKLAGTTAICWLENETLEITVSQKKQNADDFIQTIIDKLRPKLVCIDCPLSLPAAFTGSGSDFFYRSCDKELGAMSPMFLGGLTARGMQLSYNNLQVDWKEVYPKALVNELDLTDKYTKKDDANIKKFLQDLQPHCSIKLPESLHNWHLVDSLLAWLTGSRLLEDRHITYGDSNEGLIWI